jgi:ABC-type glycerol-3-phosphate transport system substrate-binding protein
VPMWPQAQDAIETTVQSVLAGKQDPQAAAQDLAGKLGEVLG